MLLFGDLFEYPYVVVLARAGAHVLIVVEHWKHWYQIYLLLVIEQQISDIHHKIEDSITGASRKSRTNFWPFPVILLILTVAVCIGENVFLESILLYNNKNEKISS